MGLLISVWRTIPTGKVGLLSVVDDPKNSVVLQIRASDVLTTGSMGFPYTLRFPRVEAIRWDKPPEDCLSVDEFMEIANKQQNKLVRRSNEQSDDEEEEDEASRSRRSKPGVKRVKANNRSQAQVLDTYRQIELGPLPHTSTLLAGNEFVIVNLEEPFSRERLEMEIVKHGGKRVQNCLNSTTVAIACFNDFKCRLINERFGLPVLRPEW